MQTTRNSVNQIYFAELFRMFPLLFRFAIASRPAGWCGTVTLELPIIKQKFWIEPITPFDERAFRQLGARAFRRGTHQVDNGREEKLPRAFVMERQAPIPIFLPLPRVAASRT